MRNWNGCCVICSICRRWHKYVTQVLSSFCVQGSQHWFQHGKTTFDLHVREKFMAVAWATAIDARLAISQQHESCAVTMSLSYDPWTLQENECWRHDQRWTCKRWRAPLRVTLTGLLCSETEHCRQMTATCTLCSEEFLGLLMTSACFWSNCRALIFRAMPRNKLILLTVFGGIGGNRV